MKHKGYHIVMASILSDEQAQHFIESKSTRILAVYVLKERR